MERNTIFTEIQRLRQVEWRQARQLALRTRQWDRLIQGELRRFAQTMWDGRRYLPWLGRHSYRLRSQHGDGTLAWWVEKDIPPYDRYLCAAYLVQLTLDRDGQPSVTVHSGNGVYPVAALDADHLEIALTRAAKDAPLTIPRNMGAALDP